MNRYQFIFTIFLFMLSVGTPAQELRPAGKYEVADTTIEVYNVGEFNTIREFKTIHGTNIIKYREFNKLTKKIREEGEFKNGYSSGVWKFYGWTGRLKKEIDYDGKVKTYYVKKEGETAITEEAVAAFDFEKFRQDSIFVANYRKSQNGGAAAGNTVKPAESANGVTIGTVNIGSVNITQDAKKQEIAAANVQVENTDSTKQKAEEADSTKQKAVTGILGKLNIFKKSDEKKEETKPSVESISVKSTFLDEGKSAEPKKETVPPTEKKAATDLVTKPAEPKKEKPVAEEKKPAPAVVAKPAEPKKEVTPPTEKKAATDVAAKPAEPKKEKPATEEKKAAPAVVAKPVEPKKEKEAPSEKKVLTGTMATPVEPKKEATSAEKKPVPVPAVKPVESRKEPASAPVEKKAAPATPAKPAEPKKETTPAEKKPVPAPAVKPVESRKEPASAPVEKKAAPAAPAKPAEPKKEAASVEKKPAPAAETQAVSAKGGNAKQNSNTSTSAKSAVTVENKQPKTSVDTANKKVEDALNKKLQTLKKENDKMEQAVKPQKKDSMHTAPVKK